MDGTSRTRTTYDPLSDTESLFDVAFGGRLAQRLQSGAFGGEDGRHTVIARARDAADARPPAVALARCSPGSTRGARSRSTATPYFVLETSARPYTVGRLLDLTSADDAIHALLTVEGEARRLPRTARERLRERLRATELQLDKSWRFAASGWPGRSSARSSSPTGSATASSSTPSAAPPARSASRADAVLDAMSEQEGRVVRLVGLQSKDEHLRAMTVQRADVGDRPAALPRASLTRRPLRSPRDARPVARVRAARVTLNLQNRRGLRGSWSRRVLPRLNPSPKMSRMSGDRRVEVTLLRPGVPKDTPSAERKRIQLVHAAALTGIVLSVVSVVNVTLAEGGRAAVEPAITLPWMLAVLALNSRGRTWGAALLLTGFGVLYTDVQMLRRLFTSGEQLYLLVLSLLPFLVMGRAYTRSAVALSVIASGSMMWAVLSSYDYDVFDAQRRADPFLFLWNHLIIAFLFVLQASFARQIIVAAEQEVAVEKLRTDSVVRRTFPIEVARRLQGGEKFRAHRHGDASVLFCRVGGLERIGGHGSAVRQLELLRELFGEFDELCRVHEVEKIKSFGECYMVASGVPTARSDHAEALAAFALMLRDAAAEVSARAETTLKVHVGINSGPVVAGVIGEHRLTYDLWGDTVNTAQRMESLAHEDEIRISGLTFSKINHRFICASREVVEVKGKLAMRTYALEGPLDVTRSVS